MSLASLAELQQTAGAVVDEHADCQPRAIHFGDPQREYRAARETAAVFDVSDRTQIELTGPGRHEFLHNFCTNDIKRLGTGEGCEAFIANVKGRVLGHAFVFAGDESLWVETIPGAEAALLEHLDRYLLTDDVELRGRTDEWGELLLSGAKSLEKLSGVGIDATRLQPLQHSTSSEIDIAGQLFARRVDLLGKPGFLLSVQRESLGELWSLLTNSEGIVPAGSATFHALRIEAGMPWYGIDISEDNLAQEVGRTQQAISFAKGCYLGQEPIARLDALGHVNRELRGLRIASETPPPNGTPVFAPDGDKEIGRVTSSALSYADGRAVALAMLRAGFTEPGTEVLVHVGDATIPAAVFWIDG